MLVRDFKPTTCEVAAGRGGSRRLSVALLLIAQLGSVTAFDPRLAFGLGLWTKIDLGFVGLISHNGDLQDEPLQPGLHSIGIGAYLGVTVEKFSTLEDVDAFGPHSVMSKSRTPWSVVVKVANRVSGENAVAVVRAQGQEYDSKIGDLIESVLKEVFIQLDNDEIGVVRNAELNELVHEELRTQMERNWGSEVSRKIQIPYVTLDDLKCLDKKIKQQWEQQNNHRAQLKTTELMAKAEAAEHARLAAEQTAKQDREVVQAEAVSAVATIENERKIRRAKADAETDRIASEQQIEAETKRLQVLEDFAAGAAHELAMVEAKARHNNNKETNTIILGGGVDPVGAGIMSSLFGRGSGSGSEACAAPQAPTAAN